MEKNKAPLIIIILLLIISIPASIIGVGYKVYNTKHKNDKINTPSLKPFFENGKLNFYDYGTLIGNYTCENPNGYCGWAFEMLDDELYSLEYYDDNKIDYLPLIESRYAFIVDTPLLDESDEYNRSAGVILYDILENKQIDKYRAVKNYSIGIEGNYFIVQDVTNNFGVIQLTSEGVFNVVPFQYDYIGIKNDDEDTLVGLSNKLYIGYRNFNWVVINNLGQEISNRFSYPITDYNNDVVLIKDQNNMYGIYSYLGAKLLTQDYKQMKLVGKYVAVYDSFGYFSLMDYSTKQMVNKERIMVSSLEDIRFEILEDESINIYVSGGLYENVK